MSKFVEGFEQLWRITNPLLLKAGLKILHSGAIPGVIIGGGLWAGEKAYDGYTYWQTQMSRYLTNFENGLKGGWLPGR